MPLHDADVANLTGQAVGLLDADVQTVIEPADPVDPYRRQTRQWTIWPMFDKHRTLGIQVRAAWSPVEALQAILVALSTYVAETSTFWAHTFPICPGHEHASEIGIDGTDVVFTCPVTRAEVGRVTPDVAA